MNQAAAAMTPRPHPTRTAWTLACVLALAAISAACGGSSDSSTAARTVNIEMRDTAFSPTQVSVKAGESVRFVFRNVGKLDHEAFIGDAAAQMDHDTEMMGSSEMHHGGKSEAVSVAPGKNATLTHAFKAGDSLQIGCHERGHYAAGMKLTIEVAQ